MAGNYVRLNSEHAPAQAPLGKSPMPSLGSMGLGQVNHVANMIPKSPMTAHLGHFGKPSVLMAGHNTIKLGKKKARY